MLSRLTIQNYTIIRELDIRFTPGLTIITGETGAGKSIIIGALGLILGERADKKALHNETEKCIIEGVFGIKDYFLEAFFDEHDIDYSPETILRREITAEGRSRAFVNDTPVTLQLMKELGEKLVDIHSQHQVLQLNSPAFQLLMVDSFAEQGALLDDYREKFTAYKKLEKRLEQLREKSRDVLAETDYLQFQFDELDKAALREGEQETLEQELLRLEHAEDIKRSLSAISYLLEESETAVADQLKEAGRQLAALEKYSGEIGALNERLGSALIELKDIAAELTRLNESTQLDAERRQVVEERVDLIYRLEQKHRCNSVEELLNLKEELNQRLGNLSSLEDEIEGLHAELEQERMELAGMALELSRNRKDALPLIEEQVNALLVETGMPQAVFRIRLETYPEEAFHATGIDRVRFLFSANKGHPPAELDKVASGGELSRLMFCIKGLAARHTALPTIVFDEIDTGISGEIALKVGRLMQQFSSHLQVITITHLPQIAGKGDAHYFVYKESGKGPAFTNIRKLGEEERIMEIAKMLSGDNPSPSAIENARELLET